MAGTTSERQEYGLVKTINDAIDTNKGNPVIVKSRDAQVNNIYRAEKYAGRADSGSEPYTDVSLLYREKNASKAYNLSLKGEEGAPSLAGGGLRGIEAIVPGLVRRFNTAIYTALLKAGYKEGDNIPDVYAEIPAEAKQKIVIGTANMGGPIHYMYIGPMMVLGSYDKSKNIVTVNGSLIESLKYAGSHTFFFRFRKRRDDQRFDIKSIGADQFQRILGRSSKGDIGGRIVVVDKLPSTAFKVKI